MINAHMYVSPHELARQRHPGVQTRRSDHHRGLRRSAREISLEVRRQRRHGEAA